MAGRLEEGKIAAQYARALFESAVEAGDAAVRDVSKSLAELGQLLHDVPEFLDFFANPALPATEKHEILKKQFQGKVPALVFNLLLVMQDNDRLSALPDLITRYEALQQERNHSAVAEVVTAVELSSALEKKMTTVLKKAYGLNEVIIQNRVDPGILGGAIIKIHDKVIDGSFVGKLEALRKQMG
jgi:F-type H+-transporting ATPase subunit delta